MHTLTASHISKQFSHKTALDDVTLSFTSGSVYALLGENGAGKSTLASILAGDAQPTSGSLMLDGTPVSFRSPHNALENGIGMVRQQPLLSDELTILENCILGNEKTGAAGVLKIKEAAAELEKLESSWNFSVPLDEKAGNLYAPERLFGTLLANLYKKPHFLILDEPSATLEMRKRLSLFAALRSKAHQNGLCVIFITHSIQEALDFADHITVLQKGRVVYEKDITLDKPEVSEIEDKLFARAKTDSFSFDGAAHPDKSIFKDSSTGTTYDEPMLELKDVCVMPRDRAGLQNIWFSVPKGKLTCITGHRERGLETLEDLLTGMLSPSEAHTFKGEIRFDGRRIRKLTPRFLRKHGTALVPSRKMIRGSHPDLTISELLASTGANPAAILEQVQTDITPHEKVRSLSGGMLQRLIIARELYTDPTFVIMCSPSYGLDRFSTGKVAETVEALLSRGATVLVLGEEPELIPLASNICRLSSCSRPHTEGEAV